MQKQSVELTTGADLKVSQETLNCNFPISKLPPRILLENLEPSPLKQNEIKPLTPSLKPISRRYNSSLNVMSNNIQREENISSPRIKLNHT